MTMRTLWLAVSAATLTTGCPGEGANLSRLSDEHGDEHGDGHSEHEGGGSHAGEIKLGSEALEAARLTVEPARLGRLRAQIGVAARVDLDPTRHAIVGAWIGGQVDGIRVRTGDHILQKARLASVHTPELGSAVGAYRSARALHKAAQARLERLEMLEAGGVSSQAQVLDAQAAVAETLGALEAAEERLRVLGVDPFEGDPTQGEHYPAHVPVVSPIKGEVLEVFVSIGQQVEPGMPLFRVGDLDEVWLLADIYAADLAKVQEGQEVTFTVDAWPGERFVGTVDQVGSWVEPSSRTVELRVVVANPDHRLKPNLFAQATIASMESEGAEAVVLPASAISDIEGRRCVFIQEEPGVFELREVQVAAQSGESVRLNSGVAPGELVVTDGAFTLKSELAKGELGEGHAH